MTTQIRKTGPVAYSTLKGKSQYVIARYLLALIKSNYTEDQYLYHNGAEGMTLALLNEQVGTDYSDAVEELASREDVTEEDIINDYKNWYYVMPISEVISTLQHDVEYYSPVN